MVKQVTFKGVGLTLIGRNLEVGQLAADFKLVGQDLTEVSLKNYDGKIKVITFFPSLDTPVCDLQVKEFNKKAVGLSSDVIVLGVSKDLPFAQSRFCSENEIKNVTVVSDYKGNSFGINYGVLIKELALLARGVLIIDLDNIVRYFQIVGEVTKSVDFKETLDNLDMVIKNPRGKSDKKITKCLPYKSGLDALGKDMVDKLLVMHRNWHLVEDKKLVKEFKFDKFQDAKCFLNIVATIAQEENHHPNITLMYDKVKVTLTTDVVDGLTENDFTMAKIIDEIKI